MDVELLFRRGIGYVLALGVILGFSLLTAGVTDRLWEEPHATAIALLSALVVVLLFTPVKAWIQEALDRLSYKERYSSRRALVRLSEDLNADLDLERTCERLLEGIGAALGAARDGDLPARRRRRDGAVPRARRAARRREPAARTRAHCWSGSRPAWRSTSSPLPTSTRSSPPTGWPGSSPAA